MYSREQVKEVDKRVEFTCITNSKQDTYKGVVVNMRSALRLAFILGARFGLAQPTAAGDYMGVWLAEHTIETPVEELAERHERAMRACTLPLAYTPDAYEEMEGYIDTDE